MNWPWLLQTMGKMYGFGPETVLEMHLPLILAYLEDPRQRAGVLVNPSEWEFERWWQQTQEKWTHGAEVG